SCSSSSSKPSTGNRHRTTTDSPDMLRNTWIVLCLLLCTAPGVGAVSQSPPGDPELRALLMEAVSQADSFSDAFDAQGWLLDTSTRMHRYIPDEAERLRFLRLVHREATRAGLKPDLVLAVIHVESLFDRFALSRAGAQGIMQVMPFWKNELGRPDDNLIDLATNLRYGCTILKYYLDLEKGDLRRALARYNGSLGSHRYPDKVQEYWYRYWYVRDCACSVPVLTQPCQQGPFGLQPRQAVHQLTGGIEDVGGRQHLWALQLQTLLEVLPHHRKGNPHAVGQFAQLLTADTVVIDAEYADIRPRRRQPVELRQLVQTGSTPLCPVV